MWFLWQNSLMPAARHQGARGECTYFEAMEQRTILLILSVFIPFFQIILENTADCAKINWTIIIITDSVIM